MSSKITFVFERIESLNETNYRSWSFSLKMLFIAKDLWKVIDSELERPDDERKSKQSKWNKKNKSVFATIALAIKPSEQEHIHNCKTAKKAWHHLKEIYHEKEMHRLVSLMKELAHAKLSLRKDKAMKEYIHETFGSPLSILINELEEEHSSSQHQQQVSLQSAVAENIFLNYSLHT